MTTTTAQRSLEQALVRLEREVGAAMYSGRWSELPVIGSGEISIVLGLDHDGDFYACKRLPVFDDDAAVRRYREVCLRYEARLREVGLEVPRASVCALDGERADGSVAYYVQPGVSAERFVHRRLHELDDDAGAALIGRVVDAIEPWANERAAPDGAAPVGIDAQLSNWALGEQDRDPLRYCDTTTPLIRGADGREQLDTRIFLKQLPRPIVPLVRLFFLRQILERYYRPREVLRDLVANLIKERLERLLPAALSRANALLVRLGDVPIDEREVRRYYRSDARMWEILLRLRYAERWLQRLLRRPYPYLLPERFER